jgi:hypothetical protein
LKKISINITLFEERNAANDCEPKRLAHAFSNNNEKKKMHVLYNLKNTSFSSK